MKTSKLLLPVIAFVFAFGAAFAGLQKTASIQSSTLATRIFYDQDNSCADVTCYDNGGGSNCSIYRADKVLSNCSNTLSTHKLP